MKKCKAWKEVAELLVSLVSVLVLLTRVLLKYYHYASSTPQQLHEDKRNRGQSSHQKTRESPRRNHVVSVCNVDNPEPWIPILRRLLLNHGHSEQSPDLLSRLSVLNFKRVSMVTAGSVETRIFPFVTQHLSGMNCTKQHPSSSELLTSLTVFFFLDGKRGRDGFQPEWEFRTGRKARQVSEVVLLLKRELIEGWWTSYDWKKGSSRVLWMVHASKLTEVVEALRILLCHFRSFWQA